MVQSPAPHRRFRDTRVSRFLQARWRLLFSAIIFVLLVVFLPKDYLLVSRLLMGWDGGVALYLILVVTMISRSNLQQLRQHSALQDEGRLAIPVLTVFAAMASLGAIVFWLRTAADGGTISPRILALLFLTTLLSWLFIHIMFALHYAHEYYAEHRGQGGGLHFPGGEKPDYRDFVYFAFVLGTSTEVSDVSITSRTIRRTVTAHGLVAFVFNVTMIALTVSIAGDAISMK
jgi:uncharacterized membrane protein